MGKFKMPTVQQFLKKKRIFGPKPEPVWVYLEKEMQANIDKKPYNHKVGNWLLFLKDLRYHYHCEARRKYRRLTREVGPPWYCELSRKQREILRDLKHGIHEDLIEDLPTRVRVALWELGVTLIFSNDILMKAMANSAEDPGVFLWDLYRIYFKISPSELLPKYTQDAMIILSSLVCIDMEECIETLEKLTPRKPRPPPPPKKPPRKYFQPKVKLGEYLQRIYVPCVIKSKMARDNKIQKPMPLDYKIRLRSEESYTEMQKKTGFLTLRRERNIKEKEKERVCHYKFWEPPSTLRNTDPKMQAYVMKLKMFKKKGRARYLKYKPPYDNLQCHIGTITYVGDHPRYLLNNYCMLPTGYIPHNGGVTKVLSEYVTIVLGHWLYPRKVEDKCDPTCDCVTKWENRIFKYLEESKCRCGHLYDFGHKGKATEKYFHPPSKNGPHWLDHAKIYQMDPWEDFIKTTVRDALASRDVTPETSDPTISAAGLKEEELLAAFLSDVSDTPLLIPHLPKANHLNSLKVWVKNRIKGPLSAKAHKNLLLQSQRRWLDLKHIDFKARAYSIPFTLKQLKNINFSHRYMIQRLFETLLHNFSARNRRLQVEQTRLWWPTMKYDIYPSEKFLDTFFTYMPGRYKDTFIVDPYSSERTPHKSGRTCPL